MQRQLPAEIRGTVKPYKGNGRKLGYPTANIGVNTNLPDGVYFGFANMAGYKHAPSIIFIGTPTTVGDTERRIEVHLLDISDQDYYGENIAVVVQYFHRSNQTFASVDELKQVMQADEATARKWFAKRTKTGDN